MAYSSAMDRAAPSGLVSPAPSLKPGVRCASTLTAICWMFVCCLPAYARNGTAPVANSAAQPPPVQTLPFSAIRVRSSPDAAWLAIVRLDKCGNRSLACVARTGAWRDVLDLTAEESVETILWSEDSHTAAFLISGARLVAVDPRSGITLADSRLATGNDRLCSIRLASDGTSAFFRRCSSNTSAPGKEARIRIR